MSQQGSGGTQEARNELVDDQALKAVRSVLSSTIDTPQVLEFVPSKVLHRTGGRLKSCGNLASGVQDTYASAGRVGLAATDIGTREMLAIFREHGLAASDEVWIIDKAIYVLRVHRDGTPEKMA